MMLKQSYVLIEKVRYKIHFFSWNEWQENNEQTVNVNWLRACNSCDRWRVKRFLCGSVIVVLLQRPFYQAIWHRVSKITNLIDTASNLLDFSNNTTNQILLCKQKTCKPINVMGQKYWIRVSNKKNNGIREKERNKSLHIIQYIKTYYNVNLLLVKLIWYLFQ